MQITELDGKFIYSKESTQIDQSATKSEIHTQWQKWEFAKQMAKKIINDIRSFSIDKFGEDDTIEIEADIITELGFTTKQLTSSSNASTSSVATPSRIVKAFEKVDCDLWKRCQDQFASLDTIRLYKSALRPMVERYNALGKIEEKRATQ